MEGESDRDGMRNVASRRTFREDRDEVVAGRGVLCARNPARIRVRADVLVMALVGDGVLAHGEC